MADPAGLRRDYREGELDEATVGDDPFALFSAWFTDALQAGLVEPNAMTLATVDGDGRPSARVVLLKGFDRGGFRWFTNYESRKAKDLEANARAALLFWFDRLERQIRIEGTVDRVTAEESATYFQSRPRGSQIGAWASPQSQEIESRGALDARETEVLERFGDGPIERPPHWGGFRLVPDAFEFWQGRRARLHDRFGFTRVDDGWRRVRLAP